MKRLSRSDSNKRSMKLSLKRRLTLERLDNRSLLAGFPISFGGNSDEAGRSVATDISGNVFVAGTSGGTVDFDPGPGTANLKVTGGGFLAKYNADGTFAWVRNSGSASSVILDASGNAFLAGSFTGALRITGINRAANGSNVSYSSLSLKSHNNGQSQDALIVKFGSTGIVAGAWQFGGNSSIASASASSVAIDTANGSVYVAGQFAGTVDFNPDPAIAAVFNQTSAGSSDAFMVKLDVSGGFDWSKRAGSIGNDVTPRWTKTFGGVDNDLARSPAIDPLTGDIYITGYFISTVDFDPGAGAYLLTSTAQNAYVVKVKSDGSFGGWATQLKGTGSNSFSAAWDPSSNTVFATGYFVGSLVASTITGPSGPTLTSISPNNGDVFVVKLAGGTGLPPSALNAAVPARMAVSGSLSLSQVTPIFDAALANWQATGADISSLRSADIRVANLGGSLLGLASGNTITLDDNAAGWGWFIDSTPSDDSEFLNADNQGEMHRMDLLSVLMHEIGHLLGHDHDDEGVMAETMAAGTRSFEMEQVHVAATDLAFVERLDFDNEFSFAKAKRRR